MSICQTIITSFNSANIYDSLFRTDYLYIVKCSRFALVITAVCRTNFSDMKFILVLLETFFAFHISNVNRADEACNPEPELTPINGYLLVQLN